MRRMRQDDGMGFIPPHPMNQEGHHCSYTCVKSRAQVVTEEQQMLHLHDGSRPAPNELEFTSEPQWQSSSHRQQWEAGIKTPLPQTSSQQCVLPPHCIFHGPSSLLQDSQAKHVPSKTSASLKKGAQLFQKEPWGYQRQPPVCAPQPHLLPPPNHSQEAEKAETSLEENSSNSNHPPRSGFKWLSDPFKQI